LDWKTVGAYCFFQILAGIVAAFSYAILFWNAFNLGPSKGFDATSAGFCEFFYTFMLCFVVLNVAAARKYSAPEDGWGGEGGNQWYGLAIGFVIVAGAYGAGVVSGGCFNPAVAIGIDTSSAGLGFGWCIVYTLFELAGAAFAVWVFKAVRPEDFWSQDRREQWVREKRGPALASELTSEFFGTFMLVLTVGLNVLGNSPAGAFSIAASLMCMIYALGDVSGANFNPAVTLAILASRMTDMTPKKAAFYMLAQTAGGIVAAVFYTLIHNGKSFPLGPQPGFKWGQVAVAEIIFTFVLCFVVLCTAVSDKTKSANMFGLAIGSCVTVGGFAIGSISGGSLNPAVSIGIASSHAIRGGGGGASAAFLYSAFEFVGAAAAAGIVAVTHAKKEAF